MSEAGSGRTCCMRARRRRLWPLRSLLRLLALRARLRRPPRTRRQVFSTRAPRAKNFSGTSSASVLKTRPCQQQPRVYHCSADEARACAPVLPPAWQRPLQGHGHRDSRAHLHMLGPSADASRRPPTTPQSKQDRIEERQPAARPSDRADAARPARAVQWGCSRRAPIYAAPSRTPLTGDRTVTDACKARIRRQREPSRAALRRTRTLRLCTPCGARHRPTAPAPP
jgi:hypothetical protein